MNNAERTTIHLGPKPTYGTAPMECLRPAADTAVQVYCVQYKRYAGDADRYRKVMESTDPVLAPLIRLAVEMADRDRAVALANRGRYTNPNRDTNGAMKWAAVLALKALHNELAPLPAPAPLPPQETHCPHGVSFKDDCAECDAFC